MAHSSGWTVRTASGARVNDSGLIHAVAFTVWNVHDVTPATEGGMGLIQ